MPRHEVFEVILTRNGMGDQLVSPRDEGPLLSTPEHQDPHAPDAVVTEDMARAIRELASVDPRLACVARMYLQCRIPHDQIASLLGVPRAAVERDWRFVRSWLANRVLS